MNEYVARERAPRRLVLCFDGTWDDAAGSGGKTNVILLARAIRGISERDGLEQTVLYLSGIGSTGFWIERLLEGATGFGIGDIILTGYLFLVQNYVPGDEIFLFGFSRGAFVARSLSGLIASAGLIARRSIDQVSKAWAFYRSTTMERTPERFSKDNPSIASFGAVPIQFLGVWDTVGALGVPGKLFGRIDRKYFGFHDTNPSPNLRKGCQALAIDEHRSDFVPTLWTGHRTGHLSAQSSIEQVWFAGSHCDVGGGYPSATSKEHEEPFSGRLANIPLLWMVDRAQNEGLSFDHTLLPKPDPQNALALQHDSSEGFLWLPDRLRPTYRLIEDAPIQRASWWSRLYASTFPPENSGASLSVGIGQRIHESAMARYDHQVCVAKTSRPSCDRKVLYRPLNLTAALTRGASPWKG